MSTAPETTSSRPGTCPAATSARTACRRLSLACRSRRRSSVRRSSTSARIAPSWAWSGLARASRSAIDERSWSSVWASAGVRGLSLSAALRGSRGCLARCHGSKLLLVTHRAPLEDDPVDDAAGYEKGAGHQVRRRDRHIGADLAIEVVADQEEHACPDRGGRRHRRQEDAVADPEYAGKHRDHHAQPGDLAPQHDHQGAVLDEPALHHLQASLLDVHVGAVLLDEGLAESTRQPVKDAGTRHRAEHDREKSGDHPKPRASDLMPRRHD